MKYINIAIVAFVILFTSCQEKKADKIFALFETNKGNIKVELYHQAAPMTVGNFVALAEGTMENTAKVNGQPFYDGLKFHRVITKANGDAQDFMIQGGDPLGTGMGDPGYKFPDEFVDSLTFDEPFLLAMANSGPNTNGSQFFITVAPTAWLNNKHTIFGKVVEGVEVLNNIKKDDIMNKVRIIREGDGGKGFDALKAFEDGKASYQAKEKERAALAQEEAARAQEKLENFVKNTYPNAQKTASGIFYVIEKEGKGKRPTAQNQVEVHYEGKLLDGSVFDSSYERDQTITFGLNQVIPGWTEGMQLFKEGGKGTLIIPYPLAYGAQGRPPVIPAKADLIFNIELFEVK